MTSPKWTYTLDDSSLHEGEMVPTYPLGVNIILARVDGIVYALSGTCLHMACPLFMGRLERHIITCPCHDWRFDVRTGKFINSPELGLTIYPVKNDAGKLFINLG